MDFNKGNRNPLLLMDIGNFRSDANRTHFQILDLSGEFLKIGNEQTQELKIVQREIVNRKETSKRKSWSHDTNSRLPPSSLL